MISRRRLVAFLAVVVAATLLVGLWNAAFQNAQQAAIARIESMGGRVVTTHGGPAWMTRLFSDRNPWFEERATVVNLSHTQVSDQSLDCLNGLNRIERLNLADTPVSDAGLEVLRGLPRLKALDLSRTKITGAGLRNLRDLHSLEYLYLSDTDTGDADLQSLQGFTKLMQLDLNGTKATEAGIKKLHEGLPGITFIDVSAAK